MVACVANSLSRFQRIRREGWNAHAFSKRPPRDAAAAISQEKSIMTPLYKPTWWLTTNEYIQKNPFVIPLGPPNRPIESNKIYRSYDEWPRILLQGVGLFSLSLTFFFLSCGKLFFRFQLVYFKMNLLSIISQMRHDRGFYTKDTFFPENAFITVLNLASGNRSALSIFLLPDMIGHPIVRKNSRNIKIYFLFLILLLKFLVF